jgi:cyanate lyase
MRFRFQAWHNDSSEAPMLNQLFELMITKAEPVTQIREAKLAKGLTWEQIAEHVGKSPVFLTSACLGENSLSREDAEKLCALLDLDKAVERHLQRCPMKRSDLRRFRRTR